MLRCQIATSASAFEAHECGGGGACGGASPSRPAITVTSVARPWSSVAATRGVAPPHSMVKYGSTILCSAGRLSQIWNSSSGLGPSVSTKGNISACWIPDPAVIHWVSPAPNRAVAAQRVAVVDGATAHEGDGLEAAMGVLGEAGDDGAVVHAPALAPREVSPQRPAFERGRRSELPGAGRVVVVVVGDEEERVERRPLRAEGERLTDDHRLTLACRLAGRKTAGWASPRRRPPALEGPLAQATPRARAKITATSARFAPRTRRVGAVGGALHHAGRRSVVDRRLEGEPVVVGEGVDGRARQVEGSVDERRQLGSVDREVGGRRWWR